MDLLRILINLLPLILLIVVIMSVKSKREKARSKDAEQRKLADDVIAAIERAAPDLEKAVITYSTPSHYRSGSVQFKSQRGYLFEYNVSSHGYSALSPEAAGFVANKIAEHFGGCREVRNDRDCDCFQVRIRKEESRTKADIADICV